MPVVGYHASHEQHPPSALLRHAAHAEAAGFQAVSSSDHFSPWSEAEGRLAVRTPMQWSDEPGAGFSLADPSRFPGPLPDGDFAPSVVKVAAQRRDPESLLNWFERLIRRRRETPELGLGQWCTIENDTVAVLTHRCDWEGSTVIAVHNFSPDPCEVTIGLDDIDDVVALQDLLSGDRSEASDHTFTVQLPRYGYRWLRVQRQGQRLTP